MAATVYPAFSTWNASARYTAAAAVDVLLSSPTDHDIKFTLTSSDTAPTLDPNFASIVPGRNSRAMQLAIGERLWIAGGIATLEV